MKTVNEVNKGNESVSDISIFRSVPLVCFTTKVDE